MRAGWLGTMALVLTTGAANAAVYDYEGFALTFNGPSDWLMVDGAPAVTTVDVVNPKGASSKALRYEFVFRDPRVESFSAAPSRPMVRGSIAYSFEAVARDGWDFDGASAAQSLRGRFTQYGGGMVTVSSTSSFSSDGGSVSNAVTNSNATKRYEGMSAGTAYGTVLGSWSSSVATPGAQSFNSVSGAYKFDYALAASAFDWRASLQPDARLALTLTVLETPPVASPVPEAPAWGMMAAGLALTGIMVRRRRARHPG